MLIKFYLGSIFDAILEIEEKVLVKHVANLKHKVNELVNVILNATRLLEAT